MSYSMEDAREYEYPWRENYVGCEMCDGQADGTCAGCLRPICDSGDCAQPCEDCRHERYCHECLFAHGEGSDVMQYCRTHYVMQRLQDLRDSLIDSGHIKADGTLPVPAGWSGI